MQQLHLGLVGEHLAGQVKVIPAPENDTGVNSEPGLALAAFTRSSSVLKQTRKGRGDYRR